MRQRSIYATMFGLGGDAPTPEHEAERLRLRDVLMVHVREVGAAHPDRFWDYVIDAHRSYDPAKHGPSELMQLVDNVKALREDERECRAAVRAIQEFGRKACA